MRNLITCLLLLACAFALVSLSNGYVQATTITTTLSLTSSFTTLFTVSSTSITTTVSMITSVTASQTSFVSVLTSVTTSGPLAGSPVFLSNLIVGGLMLILVPLVFFILTKNLLAFTVGEIAMTFVGIPLNMIPWWAGAGNIFMVIVVYMLFRDSEEHRGYENQGETYS